MNAYCVIERKDFIPKNAKANCFTYAYYNTTTRCNIFYFQIKISPFTQASITINSLYSLNVHKSFHRKKNQFCVPFFLISTLYI